jgi:hypothetical protein
VLISTIELAPDSIRLGQTQSLITVVIASGGKRAYEGRREGPEYAPKPPFDREHEIGFTARSEHSAKSLAIIVRLAD